MYYISIAPPDSQPVITAARTQCCDRVEVRMRGGDCFAVQGAKAGGYKSQGVVYNNQPVYRQAGAGENFLFWLSEPGWQGWVIGKYKRKKSINFKYPVGENPNGLL
jgi:hypothetical protein